MTTAVIAAVASTLRAHVADLDGSVASNLTTARHLRLAGAAERWS